MHLLGTNGCLWSVNKALSLCSALVSLIQSKPAPEGLSDSTLGGYDVEVEMVNLAAGNYEQLFGAQEQHTSTCSTLHCFRKWKLSHTKTLLESLGEMMCIPWAHAAHFSF